jgi:hypothetical protein
LGDITGHSANDVGEGLKLLGVILIAVVILIVITIAIIMAINARKAY